METFSFNLTFVAIILGVATTKAIEALGHYLKKQNRERFYLPHFLLSVLVALLITQYWWGIFDERKIESWNYLKFLLLLITPLLFYLMAELLNPDDNSADMRSHYRQQFKLICLLAAGVQVSDSITDAVLHQQAISAGEYIIRLGAAALLLLVSRLKEEWQHYAALSFFYGLLFLYISLYAFDA